MTQYATKLLSGYTQVANEIGNTIRIRLYTHGGVADLTNVISATLIVQFSESYRDQRSFPLTVDPDPTTGLVSYTPVFGDFAQPPFDPIYPNVNGQIVLTFAGGSIFTSKTFEMQVRALF